jgi:hypothetical protein
MGGRLLIWVLEAHHVSDYRLETDFLLGGLGATALWGALAWVGYLALEPHFRKLWPGLLVSWSRLLEGRVRDPLVGRHLLIGCLAAAISLSATYAAFVWGHPRFALDSGPYDNVGFGERLNVIFTMFAIGIASCALLALLQALLGRRSRAEIGFVVLFGASATAVSNSVFPLPVGVSLALFQTALAPLILLRIGILPYLLGCAFGNFRGTFALSLDPSVWYFEESVLSLGIFLVVALWGFYHSLGGRPLLAGGSGPAAG